MKILLNLIWCISLAVSQSTNETHCSQGNIYNENACLISNAISEYLVADVGNEADDTMMTMTGITNLQPANDGELQIQSTINITRLFVDDCPSLENANNLSQSEFIERLTAPCRYDRSERPLGQSDKNSNPVEVYVRTYIYVLQNDGQSSQFNLQAMLELRYIDPRLAFEKVAPQRREPIQGKANLRNLIWVPHLFFTNEQDSSVLGTFEKDVRTKISPDGTVVLARRIKATLFCWLQLDKFPFDEQFCTTTLESWMYNASDLILNWEKDDPISYNPHMQFTHYALDETWHNKSLKSPLENSLWHGCSACNYSSISFTVHLVHSAGYYVMDFFIPSMIMVAISWASFWLRADQTPARTTINCSTMLSLITLSSSQLRNSSSFITILEIWFLACCLFIFCNLIEFTFSNTIYRRKNTVQLKSVTSKSILKSAVAPKRFRPKSMTESSSTIDCITFTARPTICTASTSLDSVDTLTKVPSSASLAMSMDESILDSSEINKVSNSTFATMTPQEISLWLDKKSRFLFPLAFIIFNVFFWMFALIL